MPSQYDHISVTELFGRSAAKAELDVPGEILVATYHTGQYHEGEPLNMSPCETSIEEQVVKTLLSVICHERLSFIFAVFKTFRQNETVSRDG